MTHPLVTKYNAALTRLEELEDELKTIALRQITIMKELVEQQEVPELKNDWRYVGLFTHDYIQIEEGSPTPTITLWEAPYADTPEQNVGELKIHRLILDGNDADFRLELEAELSKVAEDLREKLWKRKQAEIVYARAALAKLEGQS